jgi:hypothetical protein
VARQPLGAGDQGDPGQDGDAAAGGGVEQALFGGVAHQEDAGEQQRRGAKPDAPAHGEQGFKVARGFSGRCGRDGLGTWRRRWWFGGFRRGGFPRGGFRRDGLRRSRGRDEGCLRGDRFALRPRLRRGLAKRTAQRAQFGQRDTGAEEADNAQHIAADQQQSKQYEA